MSNLTEEMKMIIALANSMGKKIQVTGGGHLNADLNDTQFSKASRGFRKGEYVYTAVNKI